MFVIYKDKFICGIVGKKDYTYITLGDTYLRKHIVLFNIKEKMIRFQIVNSRCYVIISVSVCEFMLNLKP